MDSSLLSYGEKKGLTFGLLIHAAPHAPSFRRAMDLADLALGQSCQVFLYLLNDSVEGAHAPVILGLVERGAKVSACAFALEKRRLDCPDWICPAGLTTLSDILYYADSVCIYN